MKSNFLFILLFAFISFSLQAQESARPWLGVGIDDGKLGGVYITKSFPEAPAFKAGIIAGDEILTIDKKKVKSPQELISLIAQKGPGHTISVVLVRKSKKITKKIKLVARPDVLDMAKNALLNKKVPDFSGVDIKGKQKFKMSQQKGKVTLIEFWATWCSACLYNKPAVIDFARKQKGKVQVIAISSEKKKVVKKFIGKNKLKIPHLKTSPIIYVHSKEDVSEKFYVSSIPMFILVDKKGIVRDLVLGGGEEFLKIAQKAQKLAK